MEVVRVGGESAQRGELIGGEELASVSIEDHVEVHFLCRGLRRLLVVARLVAMGPTKPNDCGTIGDTVMMVVSRR